MVYKAKNINFDLSIFKNIDNNKTKDKITILKAIKESINNEIILDATKILYCKSFIMRFVCEVLLMFYINTFEKGEEQSLKLFRKTANIFKNKKL